MGFRLAIDVGGTFTDAALLNEETGEIGISKTPTTYGDFSNGVLTSARKVRTDPSLVTYLVHGTTIVTNVIHQRKSLRIGLITTRGFRDILELMRANRPIWGLFDIQWSKPEPLVPRYLRFEVAERIDYKGRIVTPLDEKEVREVVRRLKELGVESIAVSFIFSWMNSLHEDKAVKIIKEEFPEAYVSASSSVNPQMREYARSSTTVIDAGVKPTAHRYFGRLKEAFLKEGFKTDLLIMKSSGGVTTSDMAASSPVYIIESGPVGGTIGSAYLGGLIGEKNLIGIDMGGTTFKVSLIDNGSPRFRTSYEVEWDIPYRVPMVDISEIAAGGGSIAWIDKGGSLRVGPQSAGSDPGPACYDAGGTEPTITDANVVLGRLNPEYLIGGDMKLNKQAAENAVKTKVADPLGMDVAEAAMGIVEISNSNMLGSMRVGSVERGYDPRDFTTIAYGGAGPVVAGKLARDLNCSKVLVPMHPGIFSAIGMLVTDIRFDFMKTWITPINGIDIDKLNGHYRSLEEEAKKTIPERYSQDIELIRMADMRYIGQNYETLTPVPGGILKTEDISKTIDNFCVEHQRLYGHSKSDEPVELVALRTTILGKIHRPKFRKLQKGDMKKSLKGERKVYFERSKDFISCPIYRREQLEVDCHIDGPAIIEEYDSTTVVYPEQSATVDSLGNIMIKTM